ncbi:MAG: TIGR04197 family type VII secretion effector [Lachnospiraceae bacterium]|nr:TIGR04197 family type VII secretion effector [Lachnospiraceae bacterium]
MSDKINSSSIVAEGAINELVGIDVNDCRDKTVDFPYSEGIAGMNNGRGFANKILKSVGEFSKAVLEQANKFPEIAKAIENRDKVDSIKWESK